jgi:uncharacterized protein (TIGR00730 family)
LRFFADGKAENEIYKKDAETLGTIVAQHNIQLIYGGGKAGLMGYVADAVMQAGGTVRGVIQQVLVDLENSHEALSELIVVETIHERKRRMYELCHLAVILPGGLGTPYEFFGIFTWNGLSLHDKKIFLINSGGFFNHSLQHLQQLQDERCLYGDVKKLLTAVSSAKDSQKHISL